MESIRQFRMEGNFNAWVAYVCLQIISNLCHNH